MGLPDDYFSEMRNFAALANKSTFLDLNETWQRATWSRDDVHIAAAIGATHTIAKLVQDEGGFFNNTNTNMYYWKFKYTFLIRCQSKSYFIGHVVQRTLLPPQRWE